MSPAVLKASSATRDHSLHSLTLQLHTLSNAVVVKVNFMVPLYYILIGDYFYLINFLFLFGGLIKMRILHVETPTCHLSVV